MMMDIVLNGESNMWVFKINMPDRKALYIWIHINKRWICCIANLALLKSNTVFKFAQRVFLYVAGYNSSIVLVIDDALIL